MIIELDSILFRFNVIKLNLVCMRLLNDWLWFNLGNWSRLDGLLVVIVRGPSGWVLLPVLEDTNFIPPVVPSSVLEELSNCMQPLDKSMHAGRSVVFHVIKLLAGVNDSWVILGELSSKATMNFSRNNWSSSARWLAMCWSRLGPSWVGGVNGKVGAPIILRIDCWGIRGMVGPTWIPGRCCTRLEITLSTLVWYWGKNCMIILSNCGSKLMV